MAYDKDVAELWRQDLDALPGMTEKKMFGGLCFLQDGHMLCGVIRNVGMARVGKSSMQEACDLDGVSPFAFSGRPLDGIVRIAAEAMADDINRQNMLALALEFVVGLPPK